MTKRFRNVSMTEDLLEMNDNGLYVVLCDIEVEKLLNALHEENEQLKSELKKIYDIATVNKVKNIIEKIYDDLLYETSEESNYERKIILKCLEKIDDFGDDLE